MQGTIRPSTTGSALRFESVYAGFLGSADQIDRVREGGGAAQKRRDGITLIDPVMGDNGKVYDTYTPEMCTRMRELCEIADIITPNTTEAAILLDWDPAAKPRDPGGGVAVAARPAQPVWRAGGADRDWTSRGAGSARAACPARAARSACTAASAGIIRARGDLFASVMLAALLNGDKLADACEFAGEFVKDCIAYTAAQQTDPMHGVQFEKLLPRLIDGTYKQALRDRPLREDADRGRIAKSTACGRWL